MPGFVLGFLAWRAAKRMIKQGKSPSGRKLSEKVEFAKAAL